MSARPSSSIPNIRCICSIRPEQPASRRAFCIRQAAIRSATYITTKWVFDLRDEDIFWCTADIGWVTGHSYVIYGPLQNGATVVMYEGGPVYPQPDRFWDMIDRHKVTVLYTAPTAIRAFMRLGEQWPGAIR